MALIHTKRARRAAVVAVLLVAAGAAVSAGGCRDATEIRVVATTNAHCADVGSTTVTVGKIGDIEQNPPSTATRDCVGDGQLGSLVVIPSASNDDTVAFKVVMGVQRNAEDCKPPDYAGCVVARRSLQYLPHMGLTVNVFMDLACKDVPCGATDTCRNGTCVPANIDPNKCTGGCDQTALDGGGDAAADADADAHTDAGPACTCIPVVPANWSGPLEIFEGTGSPSPPTPPACRGAYATDIYDGNGAPSAPPAACTCACGAPSGLTCADPVANYYTDSACTTTCGTANQAIPTSCTALGVAGCTGLFTYFTLSQPAATGGSCVASATVSVTTPPAWTANVRLCESSAPPSAVGCAAGNVCAPTTGTPFESNYCVSRSGTWPCPSGYPSLRTYHESFSDTRGCTSCTCGAGTATCGGDAVTMYSNTTCGNPKEVRTAPQSCIDTNGRLGATSTGASPSGGACPAIGGSPTGTLTPTTATTVCCTL